MIVLEIDVLEKFASVVKLIKQNQTAQVVEAKVATKTQSKMFVSSSVSASLGYGKVEKSNEMRVLYPNIVNNHVNLWSMNDIDVWLSCIQFPDHSMAKEKTIADFEDSGAPIKSKIHKYCLTGAGLELYQSKLQELFATKIGIKNENAVQLLVTEAGRVLSNSSKI